MKHQRKCTCPQCKRKSTSIKVAVPVVIIGIGVAMVVAFPGLLDNVTGYFATASEPATRVTGIIERSTDRVVEELIKDTIVLQPGESKTIVYEVGSADSITLVGVISVRDGGAARFSTGYYQVPVQGPRADEYISQFPLPLLTRTSPVEIRTSLLGDEKERTMSITNLRTNMVSTVDLDLSIVYSNTIETRTPLS